MESTSEILLYYCFFHRLTSAAIDSQPSKTFAGYFQPCTNQARHCWPGASAAGRGPIRARAPGRGGGTRRGWRTHQRSDHGRQGPLSRHSCHWSRAAEGGRRVSVEAGKTRIRQVEEKYVNVAENAPHLFQVLKCSNSLFPSPLYPASIVVFSRMSIMPQPLASYSPFTKALSLHFEQSGSLQGHDGDGMPNTIADGLRMTLGSTTWPVVRCDRAINLRKMCVHVVGDP